MIDALLAEREEARKKLEAARQIRSQAWAGFEAAVYRTDPASDGEESGT